MSKKQDDDWIWLLGLLLLWLLKNLKIPPIPVPGGGGKKKDDTNIPPEDEEPLPYVPPESTPDPTIPPQITPTPEEEPNPLYVGPGPADEPNPSTGIPPPPPPPVENPIPQPTYDFPPIPSLPPIEEPAIDPIPYYTLITAGGSATPAIIEAAWETAAPATELATGIAATGLAAAGTAGILSVAPAAGAAGAAALGALAAGSGIVGAKEISGQVVEEPKNWSRGGRTVTDITQDIKQSTPAVARKKVVDYFASFRR